MDLKIGDEAPNFTANTTVGEINFHDWLGDDWGVLMSHPADFTPVCTTEIGRVANLKEDFSQRNVKVLVLSVGTKPGLTPLESHTEWIKDVNETQGASVDFPLIEDPDKELQIDSLRDEVRAALDTLKDREKDVIKMYFGIDHDYALTLNEIGEEFGLTRERVRQIKEKAIRRLRHRSRSQKLRTYLG